LKNLVACAIRLRVDCLLVAGDLYDADWKDTGTGLFFINQVRQLREAGIRVYCIRGNHDAASEISRNLPLPENIDGTPMLLAHDQCQSIHLDDLGVSIHGQSFAGRVVKENLSLNYPAPVKGHLNIGMLHTCLEGAEGHEPYAPCNAQELVARGYDYWALGHIHLRQVTKHEPGRTPVLFSGNLQGRHIRESGPKGAYLVTLEQGTTQIDFHRLDAYSWELRRLDLSELTQEDEVMRAFAEDVQTLLSENADEASSIEGENPRPLAVRFQLIGSTELHSRLTERLPQLIDELRGLSILHGQGRLWLEDVQVKTHPPAQHKDEQGLEGPLAFLVEYIDQLRSRPAELLALAAPLQDLARRLPGRHGWHQEIGARDAAWLTEVLPEVQAMLLERLTRGGTGTR
jgi:DNA repair exonuclease SbcCD nuclease subunit